MKARLADSFVEQPLEIGIASPDHPQTTSGPLRMHEDEQRIRWLILDKPGRDANVFDEEFFVALGRAIDDVASARPHALVIRSAKRSGFATGADLHMLERLTDNETTERQLRAAHAVIDRIDALPCTTIAPSRSISRIASRVAPGSGPFITRSPATDASVTPDRPKRLSRVIDTPVTQAAATNPRRYPPVGPSR